MWDAIGLSALEERLYRVLLRDPKSPPPELARQLGVTEDAVQGGLERLRELELLDGELRPADPRLALGSAIRRRRTDLDRLAQHAEALAADFQEGLLRADPGRVFEVVEGAAEAGRRIVEILSAAKHEILALDAPPYATDTDLVAEAQALARGVRCRAIYSSIVLDLPAKLDEIRRATGLGEQARVLATVPIKLIVVDGMTALLPLTDHEEGVRFTSILVGRSALTNALVALFETLWREASPIWRDGPPTSADPVDQQILELLAVGMKDEAILRQLGISERTLRRRIAGLFGRLGATGRFQAGVQAARKGWV